MDAIEVDTLSELIEFFATSGDVLNMDVSDLVDVDELLGSGEDTTDMPLAQEADAEESDVEQSFHSTLIMCQARADGLTDIPALNGVLSRTRMLRRFIKTRFAADQYVFYYLSDCQGESEAFPHGWSGCADKFMEFNLSSAETQKWVEEFRGSFDSIILYTCPIRLILDSSPKFIETLKTLLAFDDSAIYVLSAHPTYGMISTPQSKRYTDGNTKGLLECFEAAGFVQHHESDTVSYFLPE